ncbi:MAG: hypothetical protein NZ899_15390, partial [Thermoguttaceae bacterium]|nr:hypothetical protein [Thermoguttaceae bacterium]
RESRAGRVIIRKRAAAFMLEWGSGSRSAPGGDGFPESWVAVIAGQFLMQMPRHSLHRVRHRRVGRQEVQPDLPAEPG